MSMSPAPETQKKKWRKRGLWTFLVVNVLGLVLIIPILPAIFPLVRILWNTRSQESFERQNRSEQHHQVTDFTQSYGETSKPPRVAEPAPEPSFKALTNNLEAIAGLDDSEIAKIVALQFGEKTNSAAGSETFDRDSAVFHSIKKTIRKVNGKEFHCYEVDLVDQNGNHRTHVDCFEEPDLDYERSMATLDLVNDNPQLKKIYDAFSVFLGEQSSNPTNSTEEANGPNEPVFRFGPPDGQQP